LKLEAAQSSSATALGVFATAVDAITEESPNLAQLLESTVLAALPRCYGETQVKVTIKLLVRQDYTDPNEISKQNNYFISFG
jgi:hypothetical protein